MTPLRQIVAFGGGGFSMESGNQLLDEYVLGLTGAERPRVCFMPAAGGDAAEDGAALHFIGAELSRVIASPPAARGYRLDAVGERVVEMRIATAYLGDAGAAPFTPPPEAMSTAVAS